MTATSKGPGRPDDSKRPRKLPPPPKAERRQNALPFYGALAPAEAVGTCVHVLADAAIESGRPTGCPDCSTVAVPDLCLLESVANCEPLADTYTLMRDDGRVVWVYERAVVES